jgi:hypothetical protein
MVSSSHEPRWSGRLRSALGACVGWLLLAQATGCAYDPSVVPRRYEGDLTGLERVRPDPWRELYVRPDLDLRRYRAVRLAPVRMIDSVDTKGEHYASADLERVRHKFDLALRHEFERGPLLTERFGPGVLELRPLLTGVRANRPPLDATPNGVMSLSRGVGGATMQLDVVDAESGLLLAAVVDRHWGEEFTANLNRADTWGDAEEAFRWWASTVHRRLRSAGVGD